LSIENAITSANEFSECLSNQNDLVATFNTSNWLAKYARPTDRRSGERRDLTLRRATPNVA